VVKKMATMTPGRVEGPTTARSTDENGVDARHRRGLSLGIDG
jgi:hypothetical protein